MPAIELVVENTRFEEGEWADICDQVFEFLQEVTPVDTGVCRDSWEMNWSPSDCQFYNPTEYASYLDEGWSKQAPNGMLRPAVQYLRNLVS